MFKDENNVIVSLTTYDTCYDDRVYLIHSSSDKLLLESMVDIVTKDEGDRAILKVNAKDTVLCQVLREKGFEKKDRCACMLVQKHLVPNELSLCLNKNFIFELDSHFPQKCMIGREIIKQNGTNYAS